MTPPATGRQFTYDTEVKGLCLCVTAAGTKTWYLYRWTSGRPVRLKLGRYPDLIPDAARKLAENAAGRMAGGQDIQKARQDKRRGAISWGDTFRRYLDEHAKQHKKTWKEDEANNRRYLDDWAEKPLSSFDRQVISDMHREIGETAPTAANRVLSLISKVFSFAETSGLWPDRKNPATGIRKFRETSRDRFVSPDEMPKLIKAIRAYPDGTLRDFFLLSLALGARRANMLAMAWADIDLPNGLWRIPETKSGESVVVVISDDAKKILAARQAEQESAAKEEERPAGKWVFQGYGRTGHLAEPKKAWAAICAAAGVEELRIHDLRRTLGSWQAAAGASLSVIGKSLGHRTTSATQIYARLQLDSVRQSVEPVVRAMMGDDITPPS